MVRTGKPVSRLPITTAAASWAPPKLRRQCCGHLPHNHNTHDDGEGTRKWMDETGGSRSLPQAKPTAAGSLADARPKLSHDSVISTTRDTLREAPHSNECRAASLSTKFIFIWPTEPSVQTHS